MSDSPVLLANELVMLSAEDRNRMSRLYEEVRIRLEEMAMITARTLKMNAGRASEVRFCSFGLVTEIEFEAVELIRASRGSGYYDYREGACYEVGGAGSEACRAKDAKEK
jgi:hypothetical protein